MHPRLCLQKHTSTHMTMRMITPTAKMTKPTTAADAQPHSPTCA
jgi:hypothetical protein